MTVSLRDTINEYFRYLFAKLAIAKQFTQMTISINYALEQTLRTVYRGHHYQFGAVGRSQNLHSEPCDDAVGVYIRLPGNVDICDRNYHPFSW